MKNNSVINPITFKNIFSRVRNKFFFGNEQHDAEEAFSCILQQMQDELSEQRNVNLTTHNQNVKAFIDIKNNIMTNIDTSNDPSQKEKMLMTYKDLTKHMWKEKMISDAYDEISKFYRKSCFIIAELFTGFHHSVIRCPEIGCDNTNNNYDAYQHLSLPIRCRDTGDLSIYDCLADYVKPEILDDNNKWLCDKCNRYVRAQKSLAILTYPPILVMQFKRFNFLSRTKNNCAIKFPIDTSINIDPYISQVFRNESKTYRYSLRSVINHIGGIDGGHYFTYCRNNLTNKWLEYNDSHVRDVNINSSIENTAYVLVYVRE